MPFEIVRADIVNMQVDAIVNPTNAWPEVGYGVDWAIHKAAGKRLLKERTALGCIEVGDCGITGGGRLPAKYVIHAVGPVWQGGDRDEEALQRACYDRALELALDKGCESIAFPLLGAGSKGFSGEKAMKIAREAARAFLEKSDMRIYLVVFGSEMLIDVGLNNDVAVYIEERSCYWRLLSEYGVDESGLERLDTAQLKELARRLRQVRSRYLYDQAEALDRMRLRREELLNICYEASEQREHIRRPEDLSFYASAPMAASVRPMAPCAAKRESLEDRLKRADEGFSQTLLRLIDRSGMKDSQVYKKANVDRKLFSKIRSNPDYRPGKATVLAFALALELDLEGTKDLLARAGFALSHSSKFDIIVEYFIQERNYDVFEINEVLFRFDQPLIGG